VKDLEATASAETSAPRQLAFDLLADAETYPTWYPQHVPRAERLESARVKLTLRGSIGPLGGEYRIHVAEEREPPGRVTLRRLPKDPRDDEDMFVVWELSETDAGTLLEVRLKARLAIPGLVPVGGVADRFARDFVSAAKRALDAPR
jgi:hypothetical protein